MPRTAAKDGQSKYQRYRDERRRKGLKLARVWVPDAKAPGFAAEADRQMSVLRGAAEELDALDVIERLADRNAEA